MKHFGFRTFYTLKSYLKYGNSEDQGLVLQEAQIMQLTVLATLLNGIPEGFKDSITGYLVPVRDIDQLAIKLKKLIDHPTIRNEMGKQGRAFVMEKFDNRLLGKELEKIYINLIKTQ